MEEELPKSSVREGKEQAAKETEAPSLCPETDKQVTSKETKAESEEQKTEETKEPTDWFEPLEDDDDDDANSFEFPVSDKRAFGSKDPEEESLAGESERSESVAGSEKGLKRVYRPRRKRCHPDEGWEECPSLGEGWKRKETVRQKGTRSGQSDIYYMSPQGERARSRIELSIMLNRDLSSFEFKSGIFRKNGQQRLTLQRRKRKARERSSSDSSYVERGEGADTPDSHHRLTPNLSSKPAAAGPATSSANSTTESQIKSEIKTSPPKDNKIKPSDDKIKPLDDKIKLPGPTSSKPLFFPSINGEFGTDDSILVCSRCSLSFTGTWYDKQRKRPFCPSCWAFKTKEHPLIRFRKWIPCGQCAGCHNKVNCGQCSNCKDRSPESRKRLCRKRKCLCPIRKGPGGFVMPKPNNDPLEDTQELSYYQHLSLKSSDTENFTTTLDLDEDDDMSTDDDEDANLVVTGHSRQKRHARDSVKETGGKKWHKRRKRRSCGECQACLYRKDCGACDFCIDKPKFGGSNKKRQKCRLRQCQRQAMRHLLPSQWGTEADGITLLSRSRPQYTYSRKRKRGPPSEDEDDDSNQQANWSMENASSSKASYQQNLRKHQSSMQLNNAVFEQQNGVSGRGQHNSSHDSLNLKESRSLATSNVQTHVEDEVEDYPTITQIYSLADNPSDLNKEHQLMKLLNSLRSSVLPILWYAIMLEGPQMQLVQCSKQSAMTDTIVQIDSDFYYRITVQKHPLLPIHPLYDTHPSQLSSVTQVVDLLLDLDKYVVCHGLPPTESVLSRSPVILERAPTCEFLIKKNETICTNCRMLCE